MRGRRSLECRLSQQFVSPQRFAAPAQHQITDRPAAKLRRAIGDRGADANTRAEGLVGRFKPRRGVDGIAVRRVIEETPAAKIADDGRSAQVLVDVDGDDQEAERSLEGLLAAKEYIRHELVERLRLRRAPELYFRLDRAEREKARVEELLARAKKRMKSHTKPGMKKAQ